MKKFIKSELTGTNQNGTLTGWAESVFRTGLTHGVVKFAKKALKASAK